MGEFWRSAGRHLTEPAEDGRLQITDDWLRAYLFRPELAPIDTSCAAERALHERLIDEPRSTIDDVALAVLADADAGANYRAYRTYRDRLIAAPTVEAAYLDMIENGIAGIPPLFLDHLVHLILRHILDDCDDPIRLRAAEPFFRAQKVTIQDGRVMLADEETVEMHASGQGFGSLGRLLVQAETKLASVDLDVLDEGNVEIYWQRSDRFDTVLDFGFTRPGLDGFCRVLEAWIQHLRGVEVRVQPVQQISDERWRWHVGLDAEANAFLNDLYSGEEIDEARRARLLSLFRLEFVDPADMLERVRGRPVYLGLMMSEAERLSMKPQNILANLPLAARSLTAIPLPPDQRPMIDDEELKMDEDVFNMSVRKFLKKVGVTSQREIEQAVRDALKAGKIDASSNLTATVRLTVDGVDLEETITGKIDLA